MLSSLRSLRKGILILLSTWLSLVVIMWFLENQLVYFPSKADRLWEAPPCSDCKDVWFDSPSGERIHGWWIPKSGSSGAILVAHGNAGNLSTRGTLALHLRDSLQQSVLLFDYPGYGHSTGSPSENGCYHSADAAYLWLTEHQKIAGQEIILFGESLGGGVAVDLAQRHPNRALVLVSTFTSLPAVAKLQFPWLPVDTLMSNRFENRFKIARVNTPVFIAHGLNDTLIPHSHARELLTAANPPKRLLTLEAHDHNQPLPAGFFQELKRFLESTPAANNG